jgi:uracil-DNA glycosylase
MTNARSDPDCTRCRLAEGRTHVVGGVGSRSSKIVFVGEAPGKDEDTKGEPFVGRAGRMLDQALKEAGARREDVYITNIVKCRPPGNRRPRTDEVDACSVHISSEIEHMRPKVVCALGLTVAKGLFGTRGRMADIEGRPFETTIYGRKVTAIVAYHPAACLYRRDKTKQFKESIRKSLGLAGVV